MEHLSCVLLLLKHGADPALADYRGRSSVDVFRAEANQNDGIAQQTLFVLEMVSTHAFLGQNILRHSVS